MDIALIINHDDNSTSTTTTGHPGLLHSPPTTPKDHPISCCYYTLPRPAKPPTTEQFQVQLAQRQKAKSPTVHQEVTFPQLCPLPLQVAQMPLKKRPLRSHPVHSKKETMRCLGLAATPSSHQQSETLFPSGRSIVPSRLLDDRVRKKRALAPPSPMAPLPSKKARTDAAMTYDTMDIHTPEAEVFSPDWVPNLDVFNDRPSPSVLWKGTPLDIRGDPYYDRLHPSEAAIASALRLMPEQYIRCKRVLVLAAQAAQKKNLPFRKSEAQKLCRIDVNKVSALWNVFGKLGWLGTCWPGPRRRH